MKAFGGFSDISYFLIITLAEMEDKDLIKFKLLSGNKVSYPSKKLAPKSVNVHCVM